VDRETDGSLKHTEGIRKAFGLEAEPVTPVGLYVQRNEMHAAADARLGHQLDETIAVNAQRLENELDHIQVPRMNILWPGPMRAPQRQSRELAIVGIGNVLAPVAHPACASQLVQAESGGRVGHVVFESRSNDLVVPLGSIGGVAGKDIPVD